MCLSLPPGLRPGDLGQVRSPWAPPVRLEHRRWRDPALLLGASGAVLPLTTAAWFRIGWEVRSFISAGAGWVQWGLSPAWQPRAAPGVRFASPGALAWGGLTQGPQLPPAPTHLQEPFAQSLCVPGTHGIPPSPAPVTPHPSGLHTGGGCGPENWPACLPHSSDID